MKKEKVMYIQLPNGAEYRRVEVTADGRIGIVYAETCMNDTKECVDNKETVKNICVSIPKPTALIGGTEIYQKDNGLTYWYCKIKEGRDEFMHLYFKDLTEKDLLYDANGNERKFATSKQKNFKTDVLKALKNKPQEGYRWIPVFEPSKDSKGNLQYVAGKEVFRKLNSSEWEKMFKKYSPKNGSQMTSITTYFLLQLRWLKDGVATLEQLADDSKEIGHYWDSENAKHDFEKTGEREFGGLYGFVGNTYKIVKDSEASSSFSLVGGIYNINSFEFPLADVIHVISPNGTNGDGVGLLELTK